MERSERNVPPEGVADAPTRVLIAEDHPLYCEALRAVVPQACPGAVVDDVGSQSEALAAVRSDASYELVILDLNLPGAHGLSCLEALRTAAPLTPIVVVSGQEDSRTMQDVILGGATAYVPKSAPRAVLLNALRAILAGGTYMPAQVVAALRQRHVPDPPDAREELTGRQRRVLELLSKGYSNKQIARELDISEITVKAHVSSILKKLGVANRVQAVIEARRLLDGAQERR
jgi:DNA-binding NarL/FixJ family response regulator